MKKIALLLCAAAIITLNSCGVGVYTVNGGLSDESAVCFVASDEYDINVIIDGKSYVTKTVKHKKFKSRRDIKKTAQRQIAITPGRHSVKVTKDGQEVYAKDIFISTNEIKTIDL